MPLCGCLLMLNALLLPVGYETLTYQAAHSLLTRALPRPCTNVDGSCDWRSPANDERAPLYSLPAPAPDPPRVTAPHRHSTLRHNHADAARRPGYSPQPTTGGERPLSFADSAERWSPGVGGMALAHGRASFGPHSPLSLWRPPARLPSPRPPRWPPTLSPLPQPPLSRTLRVGYCPWMDY